MPENRGGIETLNLSQDFPPVPTEAWEAAIQKDLKGADYEKKLVWRTDEGIAVRPYYRADALAGLESQTSALPGQFPFVRGTGASWEIDQSGIMKDDAVRADLVLEAGGDSVQQLGIALADAVEKLTTLIDTHPVDVAAREIQFVFAIGSTYFFEIAKLRAARMLWARVVEQFKPADFDACRMNLHARTAQMNKSFADPHTNMLRATTEAMSAAIGGCGSLTVLPFGFDAHIAINIQRVLAEEAHLNAVADPAGGSYYIETLTASLAREAWKLFQRIEAAGGYTASLPWLAQEIANTRAARETGISSRRRVMVGVNDYPNLAERRIDQDAVPEIANSPFPRFRLAQPFEAIRERTARHAAESGRTPKVLLLKRGDLKMSIARSNFSLNFFGCAGFDVTEAEEHANTDADLVVLCSSDAEYLPIAQEVCSAVNVPVIVAGNPEDQAEALEAVGIRGFIHIASDAVETLTMWQDRLGVAK